MCLVLKRFLQFEFKIDIIGIREDDYKFNIYLNYLFFKFFLCRWLCWRVVRHNLYILVNLLVQQHSNQCLQTDFLGMMVMKVYFFWRECVILSIVFIIVVCQVREFEDRHLVGKENTYVHKVIVLDNVLNGTQNSSFYWDIVRNVYRFRIFWWILYTWNSIDLEHYLNVGMFTYTFSCLIVLFRIFLEICYECHDLTLKICNILGVSFSVLRYID